MKIIRGKVPHAKKFTIYGPEGIGKSTFASKFPEPVFIDTEGGTKELNVARFERPTSWAMLLEQIKYIRNNPEICKTLVVDTIDWAEQLCVEYICASHQKNGLESFGYGSGYVYVREEFGRFLNSLEEIVEKGVNVVLIAHAMLRKFEQPDEMGAYDRWELKLGKKTSSQISPLVKEWSDALLFANYKTWSVATDDKGKKRKAQGGARVMYTSHHPCWDAKNRYGLPEEVPFDYESIRHIIEGGSAAANHAVESPAMDYPVTPPTRPVQAPPATNPQSAATPPTNTQPATGMPRHDPPAQPAGNPVQQTMDLTPPLMDTGQVAMGDTSAFPPDPRIPKALRDLMIANNVCEWDIQSVVEARGYFPADMDVWDYPEDFIMGVLVGAWPQVFAMIKEMKAKDAIPFN